MSSCWWQGLFNHGKFKLQSPARPRGRRRSESRRILFEALEPRVLLDGNPQGILRPAQIGTTTVLTSSLASVVYGTPVTFTATVSAQIGSAALPPAASNLDDTSGQDLGAAP